MIRKILWIHSKEEGPKQFGESLLKGVEKLGVQVTVSDSISETDQEIDLVVSLVPQKFSTKLPVLYYLFSSPEAFFDDLKGERIFFALRDAYSLKMLEGMHYKKAFLLLNGVEKKEFKEEERIYPISFFGNAISEEKALKELPPKILRAADRAVELNYLNPYPSYHESFIYSLQLDKSIEKKDVEQLNTREILQAIEKKIQTETVVQVVQNLRHVEVHLFGKNWQGRLSQPNLHFHEELSFDEKLVRMGRSKLVLSSSFHLKYGLHEDILNAYLMGACPLTNFTPFLEEIFNPNDSILFYYPSHLHVIEREIEPFLDNEALRKKWVQKGESIALHHTWEKRALTFLTEMNRLLV